jgi:hypothetical protein
MPGETRKFHGNDNSSSTNSNTPLRLGGATNGANGSTPTTTGAALSSMASLAECLPEAEAKVHKKQQQKAAAETKKAAAAARKANKQNGNTNSNNSNGRISAAKRREMA